MAITETQLQIWANAPGNTRYQNAHNAVRSALSESTALSGKSYDVFLQGSYKNSTNIRGDSDVDIVAMYDGAYYYDISQLSPEDKQRFNATLSPASYAWDNFRQDVLSALQNYFIHSTVKPGNKAITISGNPNRVSADVTVAQDYRYYVAYQPGNVRYHEGICFFDSSKKQIVNYPKIHYNNGVTKNTASDQSYKQFVRIFKNINRWLIEEGRLPDGFAPSYFIECLLYNVPTERYAYNNYRDQLTMILDYLENNDPYEFETVSGMHWMCRGDQWPVASAKRFIQEVASYNSVALR